MSMMAMASPTHISGVFLISKDPMRLARFYQQVIGFPLAYDHVEEANGADGVRHYECDLGSVHFAIHPPRDGNEGLRSNNTMSFSINVESLDSYASRLRDKGVELSFGPLNLDFGRLAGVVDPDGNTVMITELK